MRRGVQSISSLADQAADGVFVSSGRSRVPLGDVGTNALAYVLPP